MRVKELVKYVCNILGEVFLWTSLRPCGMCSVHFHSTQYLSSCVSPDSSTRWRVLMRPPIVRFVMDFLLPSALSLALALCICIRFWGFILIPFQGKYQCYSHPWNSLALCIRTDVSRNHCVRGSYSERVFSYKLSSSSFQVDHNFSTCTPYADIFPKE